MSTPGFASSLLERAVAAKVEVSPDHIEQLGRYYSVLGRWNRRINLTALQLEGFPPETIDRLIIEPLVAAPHIEDAPLDWVDLGSGGGSPALPLKIVRPQLRLMMTESRGRKAAFLREAIRQLALAHASVSTGRFEALADLPGGAADLVTARAIAITDRTASLVRHLLKPGGRLLLFGPGDSPSLAPFDVLHTGALPGEGTRFALLGRR